MRRASNYDLGNMDWQARSYGYNDATARPQPQEIDDLISKQMPHVRFTGANKQAFLESADYAYMMRLRHRANGVKS
jgi:hypothetical protein